MFPAAKLICIARDPRDVLTSAWHFFHTATPGEDPIAAKTAFIRTAFPSLTEGTHAMLTLAKHHPADCVIVTYEALLQTPAHTVAHLFRFLGVNDDDDLVADCLAQASFATLAGHTDDME